MVGVLCLLLEGCSKTPAGAIEGVLNGCAADTEKVNRSNMSAAEAARRLALKWQTIDTRDCPRDFRVAFQEHINAWRTASGYFAQDTNLNAFLEGLVSGYFQDSSMLGHAAQNAIVAAQNINATYERLTTIAAAYGARVPNSEVSR